MNLSIGIFHYSVLLLGVSILFFSFKQKIGNLIIKDHCIRYVELKTRNPLVLSMYEEHIIPHGIITDGRIMNSDALSLILDECVTKWGIKGRKIRFTIPDSHVVIRKVSVPADLEDDEIRGHLYVEIGSKIHLPFEEAVFDYVVLNNDGKIQELILFASSEELVEQYTDILEGAKLKPVVADISSLCCYRLYRNLMKEENIVTSLLIQFDLTSENFCIFKDDKPIFMRNLLREDMEERRKEDIYIVADEMLKEIEHVVNFYRYSLTQGSEEVNQFIITGDHPNLGAIFKQLKANLVTPITLLSADDTIPYSFHLAAGLALKEEE